MGAQPAAALALAVVPHAAERVQQEDLFQLLAGASEALAAAGCKLAGGHTCEGAELSLGERVGSEVGSGFEAHAKLWATHHTPQQPP